MTGTILQAGSIALVDLGQTVGHEQSGFRPCVTVSVPTMNRETGHHFGIAVIVPLTTKAKNWWTVVKIPQQAGIEEDSFALCHQIRAISTERISRVPAALNKKDLNKIRVVLATMLGLPE